MSNMETIDDIIEKLHDADLACLREGVKAQLLLLGGSGLLFLMKMLGVEFRTTSAVTVNILTATNTQRVKIVLRNTFIAVLDVTLPDTRDFKEVRYAKVETELFKAIEVYVPSIEFLACTKIHSSRDKDLEDLKNTAILDVCNKQVLLELVEEYKARLVERNITFLNYCQLRSVMEERGIKYEDIKR